MRIISAILCFAIIFLSLLPCADVNKLAVENPQENVIKTRGHEDHCAENPCSIFCQCSATCSCAGSALSLATFKNPQLISPQLVHLPISSLAVSPSKGFPGSSLRPPQIWVILKGLFKSDFVIFNFKIEKCSCLCIIRFKIWYE